MLNCLRRLILPLVVVCAGVASAAPSSDSPRPGAAGNGGHLWLVAPAPDARNGWQVLHHHPRQAATAAMVPGAIAQPVALPDGSPAICARGGSLYVAGRLAGGGVRVEELQLGVPSPQGLELTRRNVASLPPSAKVLAMAADSQKLWMAVEAAPSALFTARWVPSGAGGPTVAAPVLSPLDLVLGLPPGTTAPKPEEVAPKGQEPPHLSDEKQVLLLREEGGRLVLAHAFDAAGSAWLASDGDRLLFAVPHALWLGDMRKSADLRPAGDLGPFTHALFAGPHAVLAEVSVEHTLANGAWSDRLKAVWSVVRDARGPAGENALSLDAGEGYGLVEWEGLPALARVASSFAPGQVAVTLAPVDLKGGVLPLVQLLEPGDPTVGRDQVLWLLAGMMLVSLALMGWTWRQGTRLLPRLPADLRRAGLLPRLGAVLIDLILAAVPVAQLSGIALVDILREWPGSGTPSSLMEMRFGFITAGLFIAHALLGEIFFGRSAGKWLMGLRVVNLQGARPAPWRLLLRGLLKILELLSPMLFIIAVFSPFGQRLGDLVAGTVVVAVRKPGENNDPN